MEGQDAELPRFCLGDCTGKAAHLLHLTMYQDNAVDTHFTAFLCVLSDLHEEFPSTPVPKVAELTA